MIIWLAELLQPYFSFFRLFEYLSFRAIVSVLTALAFSLWIGPKVILRLQMLQIGQVVRNDGPESHFSKRGTPTMGGLMILAAIVFTVILWADLTNIYVWLVLVVLLGYGTVGFVDDYRKVVRKNTDGLIARWKYFWQSFIALLVAFFFFYHSRLLFILFTPFLKYHSIISDLSPLLLLILILSDFLHQSRFS